MCGRRLRIGEILRNLLKVVYKKLGQMLGETLLSSVRDIVNRNKKNFVSLSTTKKNKKEPNKTKKTMLTGMQLAFQVER
jgi:hypothetical protein